MLPGVLLHVVEAARPVNAAIDFAGRDRPVYDVQDLVVFQIADVEDVCVAKLAEVVRLAAGSRIEVGLVEEHAPAGAVLARDEVRHRLAAQDLCREIVLERIVVVEAASGHGGYKGESSTVKPGSFRNRHWTRPVFRG